MWESSRANELTESLWAAAIPSSLLKNSLFGNFFYLENSGAW
jgi:hypothetical protein